MKISHYFFVRLIINQDVHIIINIMYVWKNLKCEFFCKTNRLAINIIEYTSLVLYSIVLLCYCNTFKSYCWIHFQAIYFVKRLFVYKYQMKEYQIVLKIFKYLYSEETVSFFYRKCNWERLLKSLKLWNE